MALIKCKECGQSHTDTRPDCPHCGFIRKDQEPEPIIKEKKVTKASRNSNNAVAILIAILVVIFIGYSLFNKNDSSSKKENYYTTNEYKQKVKEDVGNTGYVHQAVNIRSEPNTNSKILLTLEKGGRLKYMYHNTDWLKAIIGADTGYIYKKLVRTDPLPRIQVTTWSWDKDRDFGTDGAIIWNVEVENNTNEYISRVKAEITIYDYDGQITTSDYTYVKNISPFGKSSTKSYADYYGSEYKANIKITEVR